ncbi:MAG: HD family hydrolase [Chloroflexota bacterium]
MMTSELIELFLAGNQLKRTLRSGWVMRGVPNPEDVAAHSYGVSWIALTLANPIQESAGIQFDMGRLLAMALIHDVPEGKTMDIPTPAWRILPKGVKPDIERGIMQQIVKGSSQNKYLIGLWEEMNSRESAESKLVHDADKLDMYLQAWQYEKQFGNQNLAEFWENNHHFHFELSQQIYSKLRSLRRSI